MGNIAIQVHNLSKQYKIGVAKNRHDTLRDQIMHAVTSMVGRNGRSHHVEDTIWALKDVSFEIKHGESVGIIGPNGAGKSTLLKILSRITEPTTGYANIHGRVASLLEVGTGFHAELTGRENIYLNGAVLGMKKAEIDRKFDEIVDFSGVEKFIDTPVKRYSSGMYVRLAFAVAAHLEPEILIVDEVLAVGDAAFQKKCLGKMDDVARTGRTVIFVSHDLKAVEHLCRSALLINKAQLQMKDTVVNTINAYLAAYIRTPTVSIEEMPRVNGGKDIRLTGLELLNDRGEPTQVFRYGDRMVMRFHFKVLNKKHPHFAVEWTISSSRNDKILYGSCSPQSNMLVVPTEGTGCISCDIPMLPFTVGKYSVNCLLSVPHKERIDEVEGAASFDIATCDVFRTGFNVDHRSAFTTTPTSWTVLSGARPLQTDSELS
jgi:lipopolysaccharide transport system ATP-binding protein